MPPSSASVRAAGIDIGSRSIELVVVVAGRVTESHIVASGPEPLAAALTLLSDCPHDTLLATGYGRQLLEVERNAPTVTEIKAYARGARAVVPDLPHGARHRRAGHEGHGPDPARARAEF